VTAGLSRWYEWSRGGVNSGRTIRPHRWSGSRRNDGASVDLTHGGTCRYDAAPVDPFEFRAALVPALAVLYSACTPATDESAGIADDSAPRPPAKCTALETRPREAPNQTLRFRRRRGRVRSRRMLRPMSSSCDSNRFGMANVRVKV
jgi:hypothetical protein